MFDKKIKNLTRTVLAILLPVLVVSVLLVRTNSTEYRYGLRNAPCLIKMHDGAKEEIDVIGIGGSRMMALLMPSETESHYKRIYGKNITVYNLGKAGHGPDYDYQLLKDFLESSNRKVKTLLVTLQRQRKVNYHPLAYSILTNDSIIDSLNGNVRPDEIVLHIGHIVWSYIARIRDLAFNNRKESVRHIRRLSRDGKTCYSTDLITTEKAKSQLNLDKQEYMKNGIGEFNIDFTQNDSSIALYYFKKIRALAFKYNIDVKFIQLPGLVKPGLSDVSVKDFEELLNAPVLRIPIPIRHKLAKKGYRDAGHLSKDGRNLVLPWLVTEF